MIIYFNIYMIKIISYLSGDLQVVFPNNILVSCTIYVFI